MSADEMRAAVARAFEAWNRRDLDTYLSLHDPACEIHGLGPEPLGLDGLTGFYETLWSAFPDARVEVEDVVADGERGAYRYTFRGTHEGDLYGVAPTGRRVAMTGQTFFHWRGGKVAARWQNADLRSLMQQVGALPSG